MKIGKAIKPNRDENVIYIVDSGLIKNAHEHMIDVWKCPNCGYTEYLDK